MIHSSKHRFVMHPLQKYPPSCNSTIFQFFRSGSSMLKRETSSLTRDSSRFSRTRESRESFINQMRTSSLETRESFANQTRAGSRDSVQESSSSGVSSDISHSRWVFVDFKRIFTEDLFYYTLCESPGTYRTSSESTVYGYFRSPLKTAVELQRYMDILCYRWVFRDISHSRWVLSGVNLQMSISCKGNMRKNRYLQRYTVHVCTFINKNSAPFRSRGRK